MTRSAIFGALVLLCAIVCLAGSLSHGGRTVSLNQTGLDHARKLIADGHVVNDKHGDWAAHKPSAKDESEFVRQRGPGEYGHWHLGLDESHRGESKARYKFPFGDFKNVHRCALIAAQSRARQYGYSDIDNAATELLKLIEQQQ